MSLRGSVLSDRSQLQKKNVIYYFIYTKFKKRQNWSTVVEVRNVARTFEM